MNDIHIDKLHLEVFSNFKEMPYKVFEAIVIPCYATMPEAKLRAKLMWVLILSSPSFRSIKTIIVTCWHLIFGGWITKMINVPVLLPSGEVVQTKAMKSNQVTRLEWAITQMDPYTQFIFDFFKNEKEFYFPNIGSKLRFSTNETFTFFDDVRNLDKMKVRELIIFTNFLIGYTSTKNEQLRDEMISFLYPNEPMKNIQKLSWEMKTFIMRSAYKWYDKFTANFPLLCPRNQKSANILQIQDAPGKTPDWNTMVVFEIAAEHFGLIEDRMEASAFDAYFFMNAEIKRSKKKS